jgi:hypothetical protein
VSFRAGPAMCGDSRNAALLFLRELEMASAPP